MTQREGRIIRRGNINPEVEIYRYVTEKTFDSYSYQLVENKQRFISQIMTSKSPVRSAEDVDEQALSYAEIKALATGNPMIIEKCQLEMDVGKLKLLKSSHLSQRYALEDKILKTFPAHIRKLNEEIEGFVQDIAAAEQHPKAAEGEFVGIVINDKSYTDKKVAGDSILKYCQAKHNPEPELFGEYRGFPLDLSYNSFSKEFCLTLKGRLSHTVALGTDALGNFTRLDNCIERFGEHLNYSKRELDGVKAQLETAKTEVQVPFAKEAELAEKLARLTEVNIALNLDKRELEVIDSGEPDEGDTVGQERKSKSRER